MSLAVAVVVDRYSWPIHGCLFEVRPSVSVKLSIKVRIETTLKDWVIGKVDASNNMSRLELCV